MPKETRICPLFKMNRIDDPNCTRMGCEWWRGSQEQGCCAIWDIAGWLDHLHKLAKPSDDAPALGNKPLSLHKPKQEPEPEPEPETEMPEIEAEDE